MKKSLLIVSLLLASAGSVSAAAAGPTRVSNYGPWISQTVPGLVVTVIGWDVPILVETEEGKRSETSGFVTFSRNGRYAARGSHVPADIPLHNNNENWFRLPKEEFQRKFRKAQSGEAGQR